MSRGNSFQGKWNVRSGWWKCLFSVAPQLCYSHNASFLMRKWALALCPGKWEKQGLCRSSVTQQWDQSEPGLEMNSFNRCQADFAVIFYRSRAQRSVGPCREVPIPVSTFPFHQLPMCSWLIIPSFCWLIFLYLHLKQERTFLFNDSSCMLSLPSFW